MRFLLIFIFIFQCSLAIGDDFIVTLDNEETVNCRPLPQSDFLSECEYKGKKTLLASTLLGRKLFSVNDLGQSLEVRAVKEIRTPQGQVLFLSDSTVSDVIGEPTSLLDEMFVKASDYDSLATTPEGISRDNPLLQQVLALIDKELNDSMVHLAEEQLNLNFPDKPTIACQRIPKSNPSNAHVCSFMTCSDNQLFYSPNPGHSFHPALFQPGSVQPLRPLSYGEVRTSKMDKVLYRDPMLDLNQSFNFTPEPNDQQTESYAQYSQDATSEYFESSFPQQNFRPRYYSLNDYLPSNLGSGNTPLTGHPSDLQRLHQFEKALEECAPEKSLDVFRKNVVEFRDRLASAEVTQYVYDMVDILGSTYLASHSLPPGGCYHEGVYYDHSAFRRSREFLTRERPKTTSLEDSRKLFQAAQGMDDIAWGYRQDGCYARAHLMARRFEEMGYHVDKIWIKGDLKVDFKDGQNIEWNFHVAPVVHVPNADGSTTPYVIDPSIMEEPVPMQQWMQRMTGDQRHAPRISAFPFPENASVYGRASYVITNSDPYLPDDVDSMDEESKMFEAQSIMSEYLELTR